MARTADTYRAARRNVVREINANPAERYIFGGGQKCVHRVGTAFMRYEELISSKVN